MVGFHTHGHDIRVVILINALHKSAPAISCCVEDERAMLCSYRKLNSP